MTTSRTVAFIVPGRLDTRTGGYEYDRRIITGLRDCGWSVEVRELDDSFPHPTTAALEQADAVLSALPDGTIAVVDGLAAGAMSAAIGRHAARLSIVPVVHALLASEVGLDPVVARRFEASERCTLASASLVIAVGRSLLGALAECGVASDRIAVVEPGTDRAPLAHGSKVPDVLHFVTIATFNPGKGHELLLRALSSLSHHRWRLTCAGSTTRSPETAARVRSLITDLRLGDRVTLTGELAADAVAALYDEADVFVLATMSETHPLVICEALARGLPVVSTTTGAIPALVGRGDDAAGLLVAPGDVEALSGALARVIEDARLRESLATGARRVRERLRTWDDAVREMDSLMVRLSNHEPGTHPSAFANATADRRDAKRGGGPTGSG